MAQLYRSLLPPFIVFVFVFCLSGQAQAQYTISGFVKDSASGEVLIGAVVAARQLKQGAITNAYGFYSLTLSQEGEVVLTVDYAGYDRQELTINGGSNQSISVLLRKKELQLEEVLITEQKARENVERPTMGVIDLNVEEVELLPAIGGEVDLLKTIQLLPGVQSGSEASAGFYVRGGTNDQNLILLDEALLYNPFHLAGFLSVFNTAAIKNATLYKGSFPAQYGGRLSSILDITTKDGNLKEYHFEGGIGLIASRLMVEGPIMKDKGSFMISGRRSYIDLLIRPFLPFGQSLGYSLGDLNAKVNFQLSDRDRIYASTYLGEDRFINERIIPEVDTTTNLVAWGNRTATIRWNHLFNDKLFSNTSLLYTNYRNRQEFDQFGSKGSTQAQIQDWGAKIDFDYYPSPKHQIKFGASYMYHDIKPIDQTLTFPTGNEQDTTITNFNQQFIHEGAIYLNDEIKFNDRLSLNVGLRVPGFYGNDTSYVTWEPRATVRVGLTENASIKAGYTVMNQYIAQVASSAINNPFDFWFPTSRTVLPQRAQQWAIGYFQNFANDRYESSIEVYYKDLQNQIDFRAGANPFAADYENQLVFGTGEAYGAEFYLRKRSGRLTGWVGYTLSWNTRTFDSLNGGEPFFFRYDRRHDLSVAMVYRFNKKWSFSSVFVYGTGNAVTLPVAQFDFPGLIQNVQDYGRKNEFRMPAYIRMDLGLRYTKVKPNFETGWHIDIYNALNRRNPFFFTLGGILDVRANAVRVVGFQQSLLPMIPTLTYVFKF